MYKLPNKKTKWAHEVILLTFFFSYFLTVGHFAIGFMRYMLPLYPLFCLFAAVLVFKIFHIIQNKTKNSLSLTMLYCIFAIVVLIWPVSFIQIYNQNNTRVNATNWITQNIPAGKMILVEHWDDRLPLAGSERYRIQDLELYNPDTNEKWQKINYQLAHADYLIIASNRLYTPLQKLIDCDQLPSHRCYQKTAFYYQQLFAGNLGFQKIAEFSNYPKIPLLNITIHDHQADESFTVYDHPKIMIFKKIMQ